MSNKDEGILQQEANSLKSGQLRIDKIVFICSVFHVLCTFIGKHKSPSKEAFVWTLFFTLKGMRIIYFSLEFVFFSI